MEERPHKVQCPLCKKYTFNGDYDHAIEVDEKTGLMTCSGLKGL